MSNGNGSKPWYQSLTLRGVIVTILGFLLTTVIPLPVETGEIAEFVGKLFEVIGLVLTVIGRIRATQPIGSGG